MLCWAGTARIISPATSCTRCCMLTRQRCFRRRIEGRGMRWQQPRIACLASWRRSSLCLRISRRLRRCILPARFSSLRASPCWRCLLRVKARRACNSSSYMIGRGWNEKIRTVSHSAEIVINYIISARAWWWASSQGFAFVRNYLEGHSNQGKALSNRWKTSSET